MSQSDTSNIGLSGSELTDEERKQYEYLIEEYPELESADLARRVLDYFEEKS